MAANEKRKAGGRDGVSSSSKPAKKGRYHEYNSKSGGARRDLAEIRGPGFWITCQRRKEAKGVTEAYDLLNEVADKIYPETAESSADAQHAGDNREEEEESIEDQIKRELQTMKQSRGPQAKKPMRFASAKTNTECLIWISCAPPIDPIVLTAALVAQFRDGVAPTTRYLQRLTPCADTCHADPAAVRTLAYRVLRPIFAPEGYTQEQRDADEPITFRTEPFMRNHSGSLNRDICQQIIGDVIRNLTDSSFQIPVPASRSEPVVKEKESDGDAVKTESTSEGAGTSVQADEQVTASLKADGDAPTSVSALDASTQAVPEPDTGAPQPATDSVLVQDPLPSVRPRARVDLKHPKYTVLVSALKGVAGLSIVTEWETSKKFNLQMLAEEQVASRGEAASAQTQTKRSTEEEPLQEEAAQAESAVEGQEEAVAETTPVAEDRAHS